MTKRWKVVLLALAAVLTLCAVAAAGHPLSAVLGLGLALAGTVTYAYPVVGSTAPTATQDAGGSALTARIVMADGDTTQAVVHNWNLTTAQLAALFPFCSLRLEATGTGPGAVLINITDSSTVTVTKASAVGSSFTGVLVIQRPHSVIAQRP